MDEPVWVASVPSKNGDRLLTGAIAEKFFAQVLEQARVADFLSDEHFSVDGTLMRRGRARRVFVAKKVRSRRREGFVVADRSSLPPRVDES